jgi:hypothetical protein
MPPLEYITIQQEKEDQANQKLNDMEVEGFDVQGIVEAFQCQNINYIPLEHTQRVQHTHFKKENEPIV